MSDDRVPSPSATLDLAVDLADWMGTPDAVRWEAIKQSAILEANGLADDGDPHGRHWTLAHRLARSLNQQARAALLTCDVFQIEEDFVDLVRQASMAQVVDVDDESEPSSAPTMDLDHIHQFADPLHPADILSPEGFAVLATPIEVPSTNALDVEIDVPLTVRALSWRIGDMVSVAGDKVVPSVMPVLVRVDGWVERQPLVDAAPALAGYRFPAGLAQLGGSVLAWQGSDGERIDVHAERARTEFYETDAAGRLVGPTRNDVRLTVKTGESQVIAFGRLIAALWRLTAQFVDPEVDEATVARPSARRAARAGRSSTSVRVVHLRRVRREEEDTERDVQWSVRWLVRGHWRRLASGRLTWVRPHVKGPAEAPLRVTQRVLRSDR